MFGMVAEMAMNLSLSLSLVPPSSQVLAAWMVFILLTMASMVGPLVSSFSWCTSSMRNNLTSCTRDL